MTDEFTCFTELDTPLDFINCFNTILPESINGWTIFYYAAIFILSVGWSLGIGPARGMMVGGFISSLIGVALLALGILPMLNIFFSLIICFTGIFLVLRE